MANQFFRSLVRKSKLLGTPSHWILIALLILGLLSLEPLISTHAASPILTINPVSWDVIGLDGANINAGPNAYQIGARVCNVGDEPATNVQTSLAWDSSNPFINLVSSNVLTIPGLAQGNCADFYYPVVVSRDSNVFSNRTRQYHINASASGVTIISYSGELYVTELVSEVSPTTGVITGPSTVVVGNSYQFTLTGGSVYTDSQQLEHFIDFPNDLFQIESISSVFSRFTVPPGNSNDKIYFDACGWDRTTRTCASTGNIGGAFTTVYKVKILKPGSVQLNTTMYGFSNNIPGTNKYFYQSLVAQQFPVSAINPTETPTIPATSTATATATITPTLTATRTITPTATTIPSINLVLDVDPTQARVGQLFTFDISIANASTAQLTSAVLTDQFPLVLTITGVSPSKGTASIDSVNRIVTLSIGTISANETVTFKILAQVNNQAIVNANYSHIANLSFRVGTGTTTFSKTSNSVSYRVIGSSTLPTTGGQPKAPGTSQITWISLVIALVLAAFGIGLIFASRWARTGLPGWEGWFKKTGAILVAGGIFFGLITWAISPTERPVEQAFLPTVEESTPTSEPITAGQFFDMLPTATPERLPDYPIPTPTPGEASQGETQDTSPVERIMVPVIGLDTVVKYVPYDGFTWMIAGLKQEIAWMGDTSWPGLGKNTGLAGHVTLVDGTDGPFRHLADLSPGDTVTLYTQKNVYTYKVRSELVVEDADFSVLGPTEGSQITLITCTNWDKDIRAYLNRLVVFADLEKVEPIQAAAGN